MNKMIARIKSITIQNFKNVKYGNIDLGNADKGFKASVLGLYGQNGSGKTALIDALALLKLALSGQQIPLKFADYINVDEEFATLKYEFSVASIETQCEYDIWYEFCIKKTIDDSVQNAEHPVDGVLKYKTVLFDEVVSYSYVSENEKKKRTPIINTKTEQVFIPAKNYALFVGNKKETEMTLLVSKKMAIESSRSFVFSKQLLNVIRNNCKDEVFLHAYEKLIWFGNFELFVINTESTGLITLNALPLSFKYEEEGKSAVGSVMIKLNEASLIPQDALEIVKKVIEKMNIVLTQLVPGLTISVKELGIELFQNGTPGSKIQIMSHKNNKEIPLQYESEGIKKMISILQLLIVVYNKASITVAIDEMDSGVFEYLLGELLKIISEKGKGQLIFTSHNLRPLETLNRGFVAFTTTNPEKRYIRLSNVKKNNNLRDFYYRDIVLGEHNESVYEQTNNYEISLAFREAGELSGS